MASTPRRSASRPPARARSSWTGRCWTRRWPTTRPPSARCVGPVDGSTRDRQSGSPPSWTLRHERRDGLHQLRHPGPGAHQEGPRDPDRQLGPPAGAAPGHPAAAVLRPRGRPRQAPVARAAGCRASWPACRASSHARERRRLRLRHRAAHRRRVSRFAAEALETATPAQLLVKLYDRLLLDIDRGEAAQRAGQHVAASEQLMHAQAIVSELMSSLDVDAWSGGPGLMSPVHVPASASWSTPTSATTRRAPGLPGAGRAAGRGLAPGRRRGDHPRPRAARVRPGRRPRARRLVG